MRDALVVLACLGLGVLSVLLVAMFYEAAKTICRFWVNR